MKQSWQQKKIGVDLIAASVDLKQAKRLSAIPGALAKGLGASMEADARHRVRHLADMAIKHTPGIAKDEGDWSMLEYFGITREELPDILAELGVSGQEAQEALADPATAYELLVNLAENRRAAK